MQHLFSLKLLLCHLRICQFVITLTLVLTIPVTDKLEIRCVPVLFTDYENAGGDGYMHSTVRPAMMNLTVIDI